MSTIEHSLRTAAAVKRVKEAATATERAATALTHYCDGYDWARKELLAITNKLESLEMDMSLQREGEGLA